MLRQMGYNDFVTAGAFRASATGRLWRSELFLTSWATEMDKGHGYCLRESRFSAKTMVAMRADIRFSSVDSPEPMGADVGYPLATIRALAAIIYPEAK
jgi:hypothetical protein